MIDSNVVTLFKSNFREVAATLRKIADEVDNGDFGEVGCCAIAILGDELHVFGAGPDSEGPSVAVTLHAGFMKLSGMIVGHGK
jgi:hypothetical protein